MCEMIVLEYCIKNRKKRPKILLKSRCLEETITFFFFRAAYLSGGPRTIGHGRLFSNYKQYT